MEKAASLKVIKDELSRLTTKELTTVITALIKYRKENKELVTYLLFDSKDELEYIRNIKLEIDSALEPVTRFNARNSVKLIRKVLRSTRKAIKFSGKKETEVQLLLHFCNVIKQKNLPIDRIKVLQTLWTRCLLTSGKAISSLHEDLQHDYGEELKLLLD
jgi:hypothetical protein